MFRLKLFGGVSLEGPDGAVAGRATQRHRLAVLALLGVARNQGLSRDKIIGYVWPDADAERARALLSDSVYRINQALGGDAVSAAGDVLRLNPSRISCDAAEFLDAIDNNEFEKAIALHAAPLLDGFYVPDTGEFERWIDVERQRFKDAKTRALEALVASADDDASRVRWLRMLAAETPYSSRVALQLMHALERAGERAAAVQHAQTHARLVREDLEVEPDAEVLAYAENLRRMPAASAAARVPVPVPNAVGAAAATSAAPDPDATWRAVPTDSMETPTQRRRAPMVLIALAAIVAIVAIVAIARRGEDGATLQPGTSIVVLPFADQSPRGDHEYFADGIADELMVRLANTPGMKVVGRTTAFSFKGKSPEPRELAERLKVDAILTGGVRVADDRLRITAQLTDAKSGYELWAETYDRPREDALTIQEEIARSIVARLSGDVAALPVTRVATSSTDDPEAYNLYLRGRYEWHKRTEQGLRAAADYFGQSTLRAPRYARAYAGLGDAHAVLGFYDYLPPANAFPQAKLAALRALQLDSTMAEPHATLGYVALYYEWNWKEAEREFLRCIELNPQYSTGHQWYGNYLTAMGRFDEAIREMRAAMEIDPLSLIANAALGWSLYYSGDYSAAVQQLDHTLQLNPNFELAHLWRGLALLELKQHREAQQAMERAVLLSGGSAISTASLAHAYAIAGDTVRARAMLNELEHGRKTRYAPSFEIAKVHEALGDRAAALRWLGRARAERSHSIAFLRVDPQLRGMREDPAFQGLVRGL